MIPTRAAWPNSPTSKPSFPSGALADVPGKFSFLCYKTSPQAYMSVELSEPCCLFSPGRFYAAHVEKTIITHILINYELRFTEDAARKSRSFSWRSAVVPFSSTELLFRKRDTYG
jgi:hypothetical protein